jgi:hypothetical protein
LHERGVTNGRLPTGYRRGADGLLVPNEYAGDVRWAFEARAGGLSYSAIARALEARGVCWQAGSMVRRGERPVVAGAHPAFVDRAV